MLVSAFQELSGAASVPGASRSPGRRPTMATDTVLLAVLLGVCCAISLRGAEARPQLPVPSAPSAPGHGPGTAPMAPAPFSAAAPAPGPGPAPGAPAASFVPILQQHFEQAPDGQFRWSYAAADGTGQEAIGELTASQAIAVQGSYSYPSPEGQVLVKYVADEYGFQPTGAHIHPAILEAVRRQVEQARSEPANLYNDSGFPTNGMAGASPGPSPPLPLPLAPPSGPQGPPGPSGPPGLGGLMSGPSALL